LTVANIVVVLTIVNNGTMLVIVNILVRRLTPAPPMRFLTPKDLGALVRDERLRHGLSQTQLGEQIGASRFWVAEFERGKSGAELGLTLKALRALELVLTVESNDVSSRQEQSRKTPQHNRPVNLPRVDLSAILSKTTSSPTSEQRDPFAMYSWDGAASERPEQPRRGHNRDRKKRKRSS
jgi:transcriptional regulator with XRE-family HTH domain